MFPCASAAAVTAVLGRVQHGVVVVVVVVVVAQHLHGHHGHTKPVLHTYIHRSRCGKRSMVLEENYENKNRPAYAEGD